MRHLKLRVYPTILLSHTNILIPVCLSVLPIYNYSTSKFIQVHTHTHTHTHTYRRLISFRSYEETGDATSYPEIISLFLGTSRNKETIRSTKALTDTDSGNWHKMQSVNFPDKSTNGPSP